MIFYLTQWFRANDRSVALGWSSSPSRPRSSWWLCGGVILDTRTGSGRAAALAVRADGVPRGAVGIVTLMLLPNSPKAASWLRRDGGTGSSRSLYADKDARRITARAPSSPRAQPRGAAPGRDLPDDLHRQLRVTLFLPLIIKQINPSYSSTAIRLARRAAVRLRPAIGILVVPGSPGRPRNAATW